jgi:quercetin dioxygenase-like cupin family protein
MQAFDLRAEQRFDASERVERVLTSVDSGDFTCACWEPGQVSPNHCHPYATEAYFCLEGGGVMRTPTDRVEVTPGSFVVHPPGELHEYENGGQRSILYRVRYGTDLSPRTIAWRGQPGWRPNALDEEYIRARS